MKVEKMVEMMVVLWVVKKADKKAFLLENLLVGM